MSRFRIPIQVIRFDNIVGYDNNGDYINGTPTEMTITASVQPLSAKDNSVIAAKDGQRFTDYIKIYTDTELQPPQQSTSTRQEKEGDIVLWRNKRYRVTQCDPFQMNVISHFRVYAREENEQDA